MIQQIIISAVISAILSFVIINHECIAEWIGDVKYWFEEKLNKKR